MIWRPQCKNKERGSLVKNDQQIMFETGPSPPHGGRTARERERDKYMAKLTQGHQSQRREDKVRTQVEEGEGQDTAGAERPSGVLRQSSDLNLGPRAEEEEGLMIQGVIAGLPPSPWHLSQQGNIQASHNLSPRKCHHLPQPSAPGQAGPRDTEIWAQASENGPSTDIWTSCLPMDQHALCLPGPRAASAPAL